jgi:hypothetical protein
MIDVKLRIVYMVSISAAVLVAGCGSNSSTSAKQIPKGDPCKLADAEKMATALDVELSKGDEPRAQGPRCSYYFGNSWKDELSIDVVHGVPSATDREVEFEGLEARMGSDDGEETLCGLDVWLTPEDDTRRFGVIVFSPNPENKPCDIARRAAKVVYNGLPE